MTSFSLTRIGQLFAEYQGLLLQSTWQTLYMVAVSTIVAYLFGIPLGIWVVVTSAKSITPNRTVNQIISAVINIGRSIPFIILLVALLSFTRFIAGTTIGPTAAIVPLTVAAIPFVARMVEQSLMEVDSGLVEMGQAMGATSWQIITKILLPESLPSVLRGLSITIINLIGYSAMAGAVGGGGLGDLAIRYGYHRRQGDVMLLTIILLIIMVEGIQFAGNHLAERIDKRNQR